MHNRRPWSISPAMIAALNSAELARPAPKYDPLKDPELIRLKQLHAMALDAYQSCRDAELAAHMAKMGAQKMVTELKVRIELLSGDLGIAEEDEIHDEHEEGGP